MADPLLSGGILVLTGMARRRAGGYGPAGEFFLGLAIRDSLLNRMSSAQIGEAQRLAREWKPVLEFHPGSSDPGARERR